MYVFFWKPNEVNGFLSQWYPSRFIENGVLFFNAEQYMMYQKALLFKDDYMARKILNCKDPSVVKSMGRLISDFDEKVWENHRSAIVERGTYLKFSQNNELKMKLLSLLSLFSFDMATTIFVEASPYDRVWGIGYSEKNAMQNQARWGLNLLGQALTKIGRNM